MKIKKGRHSGDREILLDDHHHLEERYQKKAAHYIFYIPSFPLLARRIQPQKQEIEPLIPDPIW
jgi:hypothetical protein